MIEYRKARVFVREQCGEFIDFPGAGVKRGIGPRAFAAQNAGDADARAQCELHQFVGRFGVTCLAEIETDEHCLGVAPGTIKHSGRKK